MDIQKLVLNLASKKGSIKISDAVSELKETKSRQYINRKKLRKQQIYFFGFYYEQK